MKRIIKFYFDLENLDKYKIKNDIIITPAQLLQIMYLVNDIDKIIIMLNKLIDFTCVDVEKEIFDIRLNDPVEEVLDENGEVISPEENSKATKSRSRKSRGGYNKSRSKRKSGRSYKRRRESTREQRKKAKLQRSITFANMEITRNKTAIEKLETSITKKSELAKLEMDQKTEKAKLEIEARKIRLKLIEMRKEKLDAMVKNEKPCKKICKKSTKKKNPDDEISEDEMIGVADFGMAKIIGLVNPGADIEGFSGGNEMNNLFINATKIDIIKN
jgi:hypothetical protein